MVYVGFCGESCLGYLLRLLQVSGTGKQGELCSSWSFICFVCTCSVVVAFICDTPVDQVVCFSVQHRCFRLNIAQLSVAVC